MTDYATYFDKDTKEFKVVYSDEVTRLIADDSRAKLLTAYFEPITKPLFIFCTNERNNWGQNWSAKSRTAIYNNLNKTRKALQDFDNAKQRFQSALAGHPSGQQMNTIELVDYASFVKAYTDFINIVVNFCDVTIKAFLMISTLIFMLTMAKTRAKVMICRFCSNTKHLKLQKRR